ncbi:MAG: TIGR04255 family protein [Pirellulaceae bacterium]|nr:TIGR04255 family protein [Pirellulaceae bacterium]
MNDPPDSLNTMARTSTDFTNPPVIELVLGVQFEPVGLTNAHFGWFWRSHLGAGWESPREVDRAPEQIENFGEDFGLRIPRLGIRLQTSPVVNRLQLTHRSGDRMIQMQDTRFFYNWIRKNEEYPRYDSVKNGFQMAFEGFQNWIQEEGLGELRANQWEVIYVNHFARGTVWEDSSDWHRVLPGLLSPVVNYGGTRFENMNGEWRSEIPEQKGRLHLLLRHQPGRRSKEPRSDAIVLQLTARGPVDDSVRLLDGFNIGHEAIVRSFLDITSNEAQEYWGYPGGTT